MNIKMMIPLILAALFLGLWLFTLIYIKRGVFMTNKEKDKWFRMVVSGNMIAMLLFWTKGRKKRIC